MQLFAAPVPAGKKALEHETAYRLLAYAVQEVYGLPLPAISSTIGETIWHGPHQSA